MLIIVKKIKLINFAQCRLYFWRAWWKKVNKWFLARTLPKQLQFAKKIETSWAFWFHCFWQAKGFLCFCFIKKKEKVARIYKPSFLHTFKLISSRSVQTQGLLSFLFWSHWLKRYTLVIAYMFLVRHYGSLCSRIPDELKHWFKIASSFFYSLLLIVLQGYLALIMSNMKCV